MRVGQSRKRDANEDAIVQALEAVGVTVLKISGKGAPDLLCCFRGKWTPIEVKGPKGSLTPAQQETQRTAPFAVVTTPEEALVAIGVASSVLRA